MSVQKEMRRHRRQPRKLGIEICWAESEQGRSARGTCLDISETGISARIPFPIPLGTYAVFRVDGSGFGGTGSVRYCRREGHNYQVGLEFASGLRWKAGGD